MNIGIIGAGAIGATVARRFVEAGHRVKLAASKGPEAIREKAQAIGAEPVTVHEAVSNVEVIVLSIPLGATPDLAAVFAEVPADVVVIDTSNYYPQRDQKISEIDEGKPESVWVSEILGRPVIKAFNAVMADTLENYGLPQAAPGRIALPFSGDDERGKEVAAELVELTGFDAVDAGTLSASWRHQPGTPAYCSGLSASELREALALAQRDRAPENRDALIQKLMSSGGPLTHEIGTALNRATSVPR